MEKEKNKLSREEIALSALNALIQSGVSTNYKTYKDKPTHYAQKERKQDYASLVKNAFAIADHFIAHTNPSHKLQKILEVAKNVQDDDIEISWAPISKKNKSHSTWKFHTIISIDEEKMKITLQPTDDLNKNIQYSGEKTNFVIDVEEISYLKSVYNT
jgi:hypothetical protein